MKYNTNHYKSILIIGAGFVGNAVLQNVNDCVEVEVYDIDESRSTVLEGDLEVTLKDNKFVFCCLPTNMREDGTGKQDFSAYRHFFEKIKKLDSYWSIMRGTTFIIKSTVLYSNIEPYLKDFNIVMNPEFLNANSAVQDFAEQKQIILGGDPVQLKKTVQLYETCFNLGDVEYKFLSHREAINIKYFHNINHAYKILFWNFVQETTGNARLYAKLYESLRKGMNNEMSQIAPDGKLGYGGACFPKDVAALDEENGHQLTKFMREYNKHLRKT